MSFGAEKQLCVIIGGKTKKNCDEIGEVGDGEKEPAEMTAQGEKQSSV